MNALELIKIGSKKLKSKNISSHILDSEILLSKVLGKRREEILIGSNSKLNQEKVSKFNHLISRRILKEPIAYIINEKEFWSMNFKVNENTLIPRPETELMIYELVKIFKNKSPYILDVGTGSGCILISLLSEIQYAKGLGIDISNKALNIAKLNGKSHKLSYRMRLLRKPISELNHKKFDLIVSNPPYIRNRDIKNLDVDIKKYEPKIALDGGKDGLDLIKKVIYKAKVILKNNGMLAIEIGNEQFKIVSKILNNNNFKLVNIIRDYEDNIRSIISKKLNY